MASLWPTKLMVQRASVTSTVTETELIVSTHLLRVFLAALSITRFAICGINYSTAWPLQYCTLIAIALRVAVFLIHEFVSHATSASNLKRNEDDLCNFIQQIPGWHSATITEGPLLSPVGDSTTPGGGTLTIQMTVNGTSKKARDLLTTPAAGTFGTTAGMQFSNGTLTLQIDLGPNVTGAAVQSFLRGLKFLTKGAGLKVTTRTLHVTLSNSHGESSSVSQTINVLKKA